MNPDCLVKLGGSLLGQPHLGDWLTVIQDTGAGRVVIVPGGGHYAEDVRREQREQGFDDLEAHRRALHAMRRVGEDLVAMAPALKLAESSEEVAALLEADAIPVAVPETEWLEAGDIPPSWDWTSDSLALWLSCHLAADSMLLVKSLTPHQPVITLLRAEHDQLVDAAFPVLLQKTALPVYWAGGDQSAQLGSWLDTATRTGFCEIRP